MLQRRALEPARFIDMGGQATAWMVRVLGLALWVLGASAAAQASETDAQRKLVQEASSKSDFVRVSGTQLTLAGKPFRFVGANASVIHGANERKHSDAVLDAVAA